MCARQRCGSCRRAQAARFGAAASRRSCSRRRMPGRREQLSRATSARSARRCPGRLEAASVTSAGTPRQREKRSATALPASGRQAWSAYVQPPGPDTIARWNVICDPARGRATSTPGSVPPRTILPVGETRSDERPARAPLLHEISALPRASTRRAGAVAFAATVTAAGAPAAVASSISVAIRNARLIRGRPG